MKILMMGCALMTIVMLSSCGTAPKTAETPPQQETRQETPQRETPPPVIEEEKERETPMQPKGPSMPSAEEIEQMKNEYIVLDTDKGMIKLELFPEAAPMTSFNFRNLVEDGFYNGIIFHRVIKDFMIQMGGFTAQTPKNVPYKFQDEINPEALGLDQNTIRGLEQRGYQFDYSLPSIPLEYGVLAMANAGPNTNGSQVFIITREEGTDWLNGAHTGFGRVVEGMDIALAIADVGTDQADRPVSNIMIRSAAVVQR